MLRFLTRSALLIILVGIVTGCSKGKSGPTAPPTPPDNPNAPTVTYTAAFHDTSLVITLISPAEDLVLDGWQAYFQHTNTGTGGEYVDFAASSRQLTHGVPITLRMTGISNPNRKWSWQSDDYWYLKVSVHRLGQNTTFQLMVHQGIGL